MCHLKLIHCECKDQIQLLPTLVTCLTEAQRDSVVMLCQDLFTSYKAEPSSSDRDPRGSIHSQALYRESFFTLVLNYAPHPVP